MSSSPSRFPGFWAIQLREPTGNASWLWHGYLAARQITLLTSQWKSGKTTLVSILLARLGSGGTLAGQRLKPGKAMIVSEESPGQWLERRDLLGIGNQAYFVCRPFSGKPTLADWSDLIDHLVALQLENNFQLLVLDTLASLLPGRTENSADSMLEALLLLYRLTKLDLAVLLLHHPCKGNPLPGQAARGSGALPGLVDIVLEMSLCPGADTTDRRRRLLGFSRSRETPPQLVIELNPEGTDYLTHGDMAADLFATHWQHLRMALEDAPNRLTCQELLASWPPDFDRPCKSNLYEWLDRAADLGLISRTGTGRRKDPFRYWLPEMEKVWRADPLWRLQEAERELMAKMGLR